MDQGQVQPGTVKRGEELLLAILVLLIAIIPMAVIALAIILDTPGPVFVRRKRVADGDESFDPLEFRTLYDQMADHDIRRRVVRRDPRITPVGMLLRRARLDRLPRLFNVIQGETSLLWPRQHARALPAPRAVNLGTSGGAGVRPASIVAARAVRASTRRADPAHPEQGRLVELRRAGRAP